MRLRTLSSSKLSPSSLLPVLTASAIAFSFIRGLHWANVARGIGYADFYWSQFWLTSYHDGFIRRGLLGSALRLVLDSGSSVTSLSMIQLVISAMLIAIAMVAIYSAVAAFASPGAGLISAALFGFGPLGPMLFETTGDPLQIAFVLYLLAAFGARSAPRPARITALAAVATVAALIHEASLFFLLPHLVYASASEGQNLGRRFVQAFALTSAVSAGVALLAEKSAGAPTFFLANALDHSLLGPSLNATPGFVALIKDEFADKFADVTRVHYLIVKLMMFAAAPAALILFVSTYSARAVRLMALFVFFLGASAPLYVIAHDWGRFAALTLIMTFATSLTCEEGASDRFSAWITARRASLLRALAETPSRLSAARVVLAGVILASSVFWSDYRIDGGRPSLVAALLALALAMTWHRRKVTLAAS